MSQFKHVLYISMCSFSTGISISMEFAAISYNKAQMHLVYTPTTHTSSA